MKVLSVVGARPNFMKVAPIIAAINRHNDKHREYFASSMQASANDVEFEVRIASTGNVYRVPKDRTVVAALAEYGIDIPTSCAQGVCGTCLTRVIDGEPDHRRRHHHTAHCFVSGAAGDRVADGKD